MNLLYFIARPGLGGHTRTALSVAEALRTRGHNVTFAVGDRGTPRIIEERGFDVIRASSDDSGRHREFENRVLPSLRRDRDIEVVHGFGEEGLLELTRGCKREGLKPFLTICGGSAPVFYEYPRLRSIISLSHEVKDSLVNFSRFRPGDITVIPARVNFSDLERKYSTFDPTYQRAFEHKYGLSRNAKIVLRVARVSRKYENGIIQSAEAVGRLRAGGHNVQFVHVGYVEHSDAYRRINKCFERLNLTFNTMIAVSVQDEADEAQRLTPLGDLIIGVGRTAFEGMAAGKPVLIVGRNGFAGSVSPENMDALAYYNFSGRNVASERHGKKGAEHLAGVMQQVLEDEELAVRMGEFGRDWAYNHLEVEKAAVQYETLYNEFDESFYPTDFEIFRSAAAARALANLRRITPRGLRRRLNDAIYQYFGK